MSTTHPGGDPRHTFLKPQEVIARYRWGRTRGYLELKKASFPRPIGGAYRLDTLIDWEDWCLNVDEPAVDAVLFSMPVAHPAPTQEPSRTCVPVQADDGPAELPKRRQSRRGRTHDA